MSSDRAVSSDRVVCSDWVVCKDKVVSLLLSYGSRVLRSRKEKGKKVEVERGEKKEGHEVKHSGE